MKSSMQGQTDIRKNRTGAILVIAAVLAIAAAFILLGRKSGREYAWFLFTTKWPAAQEVRLSVAEDPIQKGAEMVEITLTNDTQKEVYFFCENLNLQKQGEAGSWLRWHQRKNAGDPETAQIEHTLKPGMSDMLEVPLVKLLPEKLQEPGPYRLHLPITFYNNSTDEWVDSYTVLPVQIVNQT